MKTDKTYEVRVEVYVRDADTGDLIAKPWAGVIAFETYQEAVNHAELCLSSTPHGPTNK